MDRVRKEVERCEALGGFIVHQSLAGGTGSGVGAFLTECMHDEYPSEQLINQVVWPYANGEVIVQNYNALLTLSHLNEFSHGILLFENDSLHSICSRRLHVATPSFTQLNRIISENLTNVLLPARITQAQPFYREQTERDDPMARGGGGGSSSGSSGGGGGKTKYLPPKDDDLLAQCPPLSWSDPLSHLFAHPSYKLSTIRTIPQLNVASKSFQASTWTYLLKYLQQMQLCGADMEDSLDWAVGTYAKRIAGLGVTKRKWHQHWSASARATGLFDVGTAMVDSTSAAASIAAAASTNASSPSPSFILQDTPLPPPAYTPAFLDGESYLECRLRLDKEEESSATRRGDAQAAEDATATPYNTTLASLLYLRGSSVCSGDASSFLDPSAYASWSLNPLMVVRESKQLHGDERLATLWSNSSAVARPLDSMLDRVYSMLDAKAYVHHYEKYGIDLEWFWQQVISLEQITADYKALAYQPTKE
jgi:hypothetical protein